METGPARFFGMQAFCGEIYIEDPHHGKESLFAQVRENPLRLGTLTIELHNANPPRGGSTLIGTYGDMWTLKRVKGKIFLRVYEMSILNDGSWVNLRCLTGHKFG